MITINMKNNLNSRKKSKIIEEFELNGIVKFKAIQTNIREITSFIDGFTMSYSNDALRRNTRFNNTKIKDVDSGFQAIKLHSETSFSPAQPEIIWFYCVRPPEDDSGKTTICDGLELWENFSASTKTFFLENPVKYKLKIPFNLNTKHKGKKKWYLGDPGVSNCFLDYDKGIIEFEYTKYAVQKSRYPGKLCFANHLLVSLNSESQLLKRTIAGNNRLPNEVNKEVLLKSKEMTKKINWSPDELVMIDNLRFMHGREKIINKKRDIVNIQTKTASFGYGNTNRKFLA